MRLVSCLRELSDSLDDWSRYLSVSFDQFRSDRDTRNMVMHAMLVSIQSSIDIATEIIVMKGLRRPVSYRDTFGVLAEAGLLSGEIAGHLSDLAGFRNVLVHNYWELDLVQVHRILIRDYPVLSEFFSIVKSFARNESCTG